MKQVGADEKRVVRLQHLAPVPVRVGTQDGPGKQHPDRLAADEPGADQALLDFEQIIQLEVAARQAENALVAPDEQAAQLLDHRLPFHGLRRGTVQIGGADE